MAKLTYVGHAAFMLEKDNLRILFDPWVVGNPTAAFTLDQLKAFKPHYVFVSHGHRDHGLDEAVEITKESGRAVGVFELIAELQRRGGNGVGANAGSTVKLPEVKVFLAPALHSCPYAVPVGFVLQWEDLTIYHAGDTGLTKDLEIVARFKPDVALIPIGGHFTLGLEEVEEAKAMVQAKRYIGMHYDTFPPIRVDKEEAKKHVELMEPGSSVEL